MSWIECDIKSDVLKTSTSIHVSLPKAPYNAADNSPRPPPPVLYLLHGLSDDQTAWGRWTSIDRYAGDMGWAVVMPDAHRSFYCNMRHGLDYWTYVSEELPQFVQQSFRVSSDRERTFVAGLSMGGYGAFKLALTHPRRFKGAGSFSGVLDLSADIKKNGALNRAASGDIFLAFGDPPLYDGTDNDLFELSSKAAKGGGPLPSLYQCCGLEDFLYSHQQPFTEHAQKLGFDIAYEEWPGAHNWSFWDTAIQKFLIWAQSLSN